MYSDIGPSETKNGNSGVWYAWTQFTLFKIFESCLLHRTILLLLKIHHMRIIYLKKLWNFSLKHSDAIKSISVFKGIVEKANWNTSLEIIESFPSAKVLNGQRARFKIVGNKYRIIVEVDFIDKTVDIRFVGTHAEYDKIDALTI